MIGIVHLQKLGSVFCDPWPMSALGQKRSFAPGQPNVRFAPIADIEKCGNWRASSYADALKGIIELLFGFSGQEGGHKRLTRVAPLPSGGTSFHSDGMFVEVVPADMCNSRIFRGRQSSS